MRQIVQLTIFGIRLAPILLIVYWILLFTGTHLPGSALKSLRFNDKLLHCVAFAGLAFLLAWALPKQLLGRLPSMLLAVIITMTYAVVDEWTQAFVPNRTPDVKDFLADCVGMILGFTAYLILRTIIKVERGGKPPEKHNQPENHSQPENHNQRVQPGARSAEKQAVSNV